MKVLSIINRKGGVGKTSIAFNLGYELWRKKKVVLYIDMDPQCDLTHILVGDGEIGEGICDIYDLVSGQSKIIDCVGEVEDNLYLIPGSTNLPLFNRGDTQNVLRKGIKELKNNECAVDYVIIDYPPTLNESNLAGLIATDSVLIVAEPDEYSRKNLLPLVDELEKIKETFNRNLEIAGVLLNKVDMRRRDTKRGIAAMQNNQVEILESYISVDASFGKSAKYKKPLFRLPYYPRSISQLSDAIAELHQKGAI